MKLKDVRNLLILYAWTQVDSKTKGVSIDCTPKCAFDDFCICIRDIIKGRVPLTPVQKKALQRYKKELRLLASKRNSLTSRKKAIKKKGLLETLFFT